MTALLRAAFGAILLLGGCASPIASPRVLARGVLPYGVATAGDAVVTVELAERFELVVRPIAFGEAAERGERRLDLGPPEHDLRALAVHGSAAFIGSDAGFIREIDLTSLREVRTFAVGAPLRALAADAHYLLSADTSGAVCLRRRRDGALLQCAQVAEPVSRLELRGDTAHLIAPPVLATWSVPALRPLSAAASTAARFHDGVVTTRGHQVIWQRGDEQRVLAELATDVRFITVTSSGSLVVAAWPRSLDDAVLLLIQ